MKTKATLILTAILLLSASFISGAKASVVILFEEIGGNVVAKTTGSFNVPLVLPNLTDSGTLFDGTPLALYYVNGNYAVWTPGSSSHSGLSATPTSAGGGTFGYSSTSSSAFVILPSGLTTGSTYTPDTTWTWSGQTLEGIGLDYLTTTPTLVFTGPASTFLDTVSFAVVPEPTTTALLIGGTVAAFAVLRRRRR